MKRSTFYLLFLGFSLLSTNIAHAQSQTTISAQSTWRSDSAHSKVGFAITHLMISEVEMTINLEMAQQ
jgi:polyisoprenoid-binding protein YceI